MALDPSRYFIVVPNMLGNGLSSSPSNTPPPYDRARFPKVHDVRVGDAGLRRHPARAPLDPAHLGREQPRLAALVGEVGEHLVEGLGLALVRPADQQRELTSEAARSEQVVERLPRQAEDVGRGRAADVAE
jgi:hypothetical protein